MTDRATATPTLIPTGRSGVVHSGGRLHHEDTERVWRGTERDRTIIRMLNDPVIGAVMYGIEMLVRGVDWTVEPASGDGINSDDADAVKAFVEECLIDMDGYWPGDTISGQLTYLGWGWAVQEIVYKVRGGPEARDKAHQSRYDDGRIGWRAWSIRPQPTREGWVFDDYGDVVALRQRDPQSGKVVDIPIDRCIHTRGAGKTNSPEGWTPLRTAYDSWYFKRNIQQVEAIGIERDLAGLPVAYYPAEWGDTDPRKLALDQIVTNIRHDEQAGVTLQSVFTEGGERELSFELLSTGGARAFDTDKIVRRYANEIVTVFLANVMRTGQDGSGSYALSDTQSGLFQQAIAAHLDICGDAINTQAIPPLMRLNGIDPALSPKLVHGRLDSADLQAFGQYLVHLSQTGLLIKTPELMEYVHNLAGIPVANLPTQDEIESEPDAEEPTAQPTEPEAA